MRSALLPVLLLIAVPKAFGQVSIGTSLPHASAAFEVQSTQQGILIPRMSSTDRDAISSPALGLMIFNTTTGAFEYYTGSTWAGIGPTSITNADVAANAAIAFSKLNISASDIRGLAPYTAGTGISITSGTVAIDNTVVTSTYSGSAAIGQNLSAGGSADASAILTATSTTKGFLPPRMTASQKAAISNAATGLIVYQTDGTPGLYVYDGASWMHHSQWYSNTASTPSVFSLSKPANLSASGAVANIGVGSGSLAGLTDGDNNVALGVNALNDITSAGNATAVGYGALATTTGTGNSALGYNAGTNNISGTNNTFLGSGTSSFGTGMTNATAIGYGAEVTTSNTIQLGNGDVTNVNTAGGITTGGSVGVGTTSPNASAALEISSNSKGFLPPRLTQSEINSISPVIGLVVYNETNDNLEVYKRGTESIDAQNTFWNMTNPALAAGFFQSFTALNSGNLSSIDIVVRNPASNGTSTIYCVIYNGANYTGTPLAISDTITPTSASNYNWDKLRFNNDNLTSLTAGNVYTMKVIPIGSTSNYTWVGVGPDVYTDGSWGWPDTGFYSSYDLAFKTYITNSAWVGL